VRRREFLLGGAAAALLAAARRRARAEARPPYSARAIGSLPGAPVSIDPTAALSWSEQTLAALVFDTLYRVDARGRVVPWLAAGDPIAAGDRAVKIPLLDGVRFHDGSTLSSVDVAASLSRAAQAPLGAWALAPITSARADGATTIRLELRRAEPNLSLLLAAPCTAITRGGKAPTLRAAIGTGPYTVDKLAAGRVELAAFADCFAGQAYLERVILRWFDKPDDEARTYEVGDADVSLRGQVAFAGHTPKYATALVDGVATTLGFLGFGRGHGFLADPSFRAALSLALGRAAFKHLGAGERVVPAVSAESPDLGGASPAAGDLAARLDDARAVLKDAAARDVTLAAALAGKGALALKLALDRTRLDDAEVAGRVVAALDALGLHASFEALEPAEHARRVAAGSPDLWLGQLVAPTSDPAHELALAFAAGGDDWAQKQLAAAPLDRAAAAAELARRWPVVPLYHRAVRAYHKKTLHGVGFDAQGRLAWADVFALGRVS
jgi:MarR-like DNA-binding transcriptional regulator SgrR of sgrS sRNA